MTKLLALVMALSAPTFAHSWYPKQCCSDQDCRPVACDELIELPDGGVRWSGFVFDKLKVQPSQDKMCHVCIATVRHMIPPTQPRCVFIQQGA